MCIRSMDHLFDMKLAGNDGSHVGAIGSNRHGNSYFQTGMMVIKPSRKHFEGILDLFLSGVPPLGHTYNNPSGRDGSLLRAYFKTNFHLIDNKYSRNLDPRKRIPKSIVAIHLRGKIKPWYNKDEKIVDQYEIFNKREFGFTYELVVSSLNL
eukprot:Tbor_TRINITY_DN5949_c0_g1::TRINITY_DN5949_c0_g1_i1::g.18156::m.18156